MDNLRGFGPSGENQHDGGLYDAPAYASFEEHRNLSLA
jgi:hypothetical protein